MRYNTHMRKTHQKSTMHLTEVMSFYLKVLYIKADMKSYILLQTAAVFFLSNLYLKEEIGSAYAMVDFICKGYLHSKKCNVRLLYVKHALNVRFETYV